MRCAQNPKPQVTLKLASRVQTERLFSHRIFDEQGPQMSAWLSREVKNHPTKLVSTM